MAEIVSQEENLDCLLFICLYCKNYRNDSMFWEQASNFFLSAPEMREEEDVCPDCFQQQFSDQRLSSCDALRVNRKENGFKTKGKLKNMFFIVSNRGCLFGDYDHGQRL